MMELTIPSQLHIKHTLESGQFFRYIDINGTFRIIFKKNIFSVKQEDNILHFEGISKNELINFFALQDDYSSQIASISKDPQIQNAVQMYPGLRILNQDIWECMIAFLCSSASNIPRIKTTLKYIAKNFGEEKEGNYLFPRVGEIDNFQKLSLCKAGYRAKFIYDVNTIVIKSFLAKLQKKEYEDAKANLIELPGIGEKIADCILLFSCHKLNAFPVDVWIERLMKEKYFPRKNVSINEIRTFAQKKFYPYAGYAQQFLYHAGRTEELQKRMNNKNK